MRLPDEISRGIATGKMVEAVTKHRGRPASNESEYPPEKYYPIYYAIELGRYEIIEIMLDHYRSNEEMFVGNPNELLKSAIKYKHPKIFALLLY